MEPNQFREARVEIGQVCQKIAVLVTQKDVEGTQSEFEKVNKLWEILAPKAEGEIQERSIKNLSLKIKGASILIAKMKPAKKPRRTVPLEIIDWTEDRLAQLSDNYLSKVFANMGSDTATIVRLSATGKGIRPSYQIKTGDQKPVAFSGAGHKPLKRLLPTGDKRISEPFSRLQLESILSKK